jgi:aspartate/methionine/tyrosine aminotransferase
MSTPVPSANGHTSTEEEQIEVVSAIRREVVDKYRPMVESQPSPIRLMARMVKEAEAMSKKAGVSPEIIAQQIVNRTIGDVNVRMITEKIDGVDYTTIGEDLGLILPGEEIGGRISDGRVHRELGRREEEIELRLLRDYNWDMRVYDVFGIGNPLLREMLAARFEKMWGIPVDVEKTFISIGALDALYKSVMTLGGHFKKKYGKAPTFGFPAPGFAVVNWHVEIAEMKLLIIKTTEENRFKLTYEQMKSLLADDPELRVLYFTVSNNPTAFDYSPDEIRDVYRAIIEDGREMAVLADLAYMGTGIEEDDRARMAVFNDPEIKSRTFFINSMSKVFTLTGDRCGWVSVDNPTWAELMRITWNNMTAGLPAQWQLRFMAYVEMFDERPEIQAKLRKLYDLRRELLRAQFAELNEEYDLFEEIGIDDHATIYNWSKLKPGQDALSLFEKTGIAGVSGGAFGYSNEYIRFSVGFIPIQQ